MTIGAAGETCNPSRDSRSRTNESIVPGFFTGARNAQCPSHFAPCSTHARSVSISAAVNATPAETGGIRIAGIAAVIRRINLLATTSPGTIARFAASSLSSRSAIPFAFASGPWHAKHLSERMGRTSRLNCTSAAPAAMAIAKKK